MSQPLVSVICLCYNHARFVAEAVLSVIDQTYPNIEIIAVDDASTDDSPNLLSALAGKYPSIKFLRNDTNQGMCRAFNRGWASAAGDFVIDFATDDVMLPGRIAAQVERFSKLDPTFGVVFTDATYIDGNGNILYNHVESLRKKGLLTDVPEGDVYQLVLSRYFICSPTMMTRREVFLALGGYDEALAYEDFDFWVRSARNFKYAFLDEVTTKVRKSSGSMSAGWYQKGDKQLHSTWRVCRKALTLNRSVGDHAALLRRVRFEFRQAVFSENVEEARLFRSLLSEMGHRNLVTDAIFLLGKLPLPLAFFRRLYHRLRYGNG